MIRNIYQPRLSVTNVGSRIVPLCPHSKYGYVGYMKNGLPSLLLQFTGYFQKYLKIGLLSILNRGGAWTS